MSFLQKKIKEASQKYYSGEDSGISDEQFDSMLNQLKKENPEDPLITMVGHGYQLDLDTTPGEKYRHRYGDVGSLPKCHNWKEYNKSSSLEVEIEASLKLDGLSVVLYYEDGELIQALTRGKDNIGIDITDKAIAILPRRILPDPDCARTCAVRGEILMSYANFEKYLMKHPDAKNPRNSAAGLINGNEITEDFKYLDIVVYTVIGIDTDLDSSPTYQDMNGWLHRNFENVVDYQTIVTGEKDFDRAMEYLRSVWYKRYPADGIVLTNNNTMCRRGENGYEIMYSAVAYKFPTDAKETVVREVEWNLSKTGYLIPIVIFDEIELAGTSVQRATGINAQYILDNRIGPGAVISVTKANEIIPQIIEVLQSSDEEELVPVICPKCEHELEWNGVHLQCVNRDCVNASIQDVLVWMDKISPYDNLGDSLRLKFLYQMFGDDISIEKIYGHGPIAYVETQTVRYNDFQKMYNNLFRHDIKLRDAIEALNIPRFGPVTSQKLGERLDIVKDILYNDNFDDYTSVVGNANWIALLDNLDKFMRLHFISDNIIWKEDKVECKGKVAITGKLSVKRSKFEEELKARGYQPTSSINKETKFLITDDPTTSTSKNIAADKFGVRKITEQEFRDTYM